jgi:hypothetical protein
VLRLGSSDCPCKANGRQAVSGLTRVAFLRKRTAARSVSAEAGLAYRFRPDLGEDRLQGLDAGRERKAVVVDCVGQQSRERVGFEADRSRVMTLK